MNSNKPSTNKSNILSQMNQSSKVPSGSYFNNQSIQKPNISPINRLSIIKTEEQKEVVSTNVYDGDKQFCVITERIKRSSNISFDLQNKSFNKNQLNFSFKQNNDDQQNEQNFQNKDINLHIADSDSKNEKKQVVSNFSKDQYKLLITKIARQLKKQIHPPKPGFFYFALQKGNYPLIIIKKLKNQIINHYIELNNDIFGIYSQKCIQYNNLINKIAKCLKKKTAVLNGNDNKTISVKLSKNNNS